MIALFNKVTIYQADGHNLIKRTGDRYRPPALLLRIYRLSYWAFTLCFSVSDPPDFLAASDLPLLKR